MTRAYITAGVILAGAAASCLNWHLALPLIAVWALLFFLHWLPFPRVARLTLTLALSQSLYCILIACLPRAPFAVSLACGALLILIRFICWITRKTSSQWPTIACLSGFILLTASGVHFILNSLLDKPFDGAAWTPTAWAALAFTFSFAIVDEQSTKTMIQKWSKALPLLIALVIAAHALQAQRIKMIVSSANPGIVAQHAFRKGYDDLGKRAALLETDRLLATQGVGEAVRYMRRQWRHLDKTRFIPSRDELETGRNNLFFIATCFGVQLLLNENETVIDGAARIDPQAIYVLTSHNRLIAITPKEIKALPVPLREAKAIHASAYGVGVLCASQAVILNNDHKIETIELTQADIAKDIALSQDGQGCFILLGTGQVDGYGRAANNDWTFIQTRYKALWKEPNAAVALRMTDDGGAYILTKNGGVHYHDATEYNRELSPFWDPNRAAMRDFAWEPASNQLLLMDHYGRLDFVDLNHVPTPEQPVAAGWPSLPAEIQFDRENAVWSGAPNRAALVVVPGADAALQFMQNGFMQAIALPQCARVRYRRGELKLDTRNLK